MRARVCAAALAGLLAAAGCGGAVAGSGEAPEHGIQGLLDRWRTRADLPAVVLAVQQGDGDAWVGASGTETRDGAVPVTTDASFRIASITKTFVAVVVLQLVEAGRLSLDDQVSQFVDGFPADGVSVRHLLTHTSGIPDYAMTDRLGHELLEHRDRRWTADEVLDLVDDAPRDFPAGSDYAYSNTNYVLLGEVISAVTGTTWAEEVRARVLGPLGMRSTYAAGAEPSTAAVLPGYFDADNDGDQENIETGRPWTSLETSEGPAGAIVSTGGDLVRFADALFRGDLVSGETLAAIVEEGPHHPRMSNYGLGVEILRPDYRTVVWGHGGLLPGFRSTLWYVPSRDAVIVVLANDSLANPPDLAELVMRELPTPP